MEKGPSEYAKYWTSTFNELAHFIRHGKQMGYNRISDYSKAAHEFAKSNNPNKLSFIGRDLSRYMYNQETNEFMIVNGDGLIVTYFPPSRGIDYFYEQFEKYGFFWE